VKMVLRRLCISLSVCLCLSIYVCTYGFVDYSTEDISLEDYSLVTINREDNSPGIESFDQFSQIAYNNIDKARVVAGTFESNLH